MVLQAAHHASKVAGKGYYKDTMPVAFRKGPQMIGIMTKKFVGTDDSQYMIRRYFEVFSDLNNRADLAFAMLHLAAKLKKKQIYAQYLYHPDMWYVVTTKNTARVYFTGSLFFVRIDNNVYLDDSFKIISREFNNELHYYPCPLAQENLEDPLAYLLLLLSGRFDEWKRDRFGDYSPHSFSLPTDVKEIRG